MFVCVHDLFTFPWNLFIVISKEIVKSNNIKYYFIEYLFQKTNALLALTFCKFIFFHINLMKFNTAKACGIYTELLILCTNVFVFPKIAQSIPLTVYIVSAAVFL